MKYIIFYASLEDASLEDDYIPSYRIAYSKEDIPSAINYAKKAYLAYNFSVFELGEEVTKEFVDKLESCPSCWKEGEHDKEYNNINTSAGTKNL